MNYEIDVLGWLGVQENIALEEFESLERVAGKIVFFENERNVEKYYNAKHKVRVMKELIQLRMDELESMRQAAKESQSIGDGLP